MNRDQLLEILDKNDIPIWQKELEGGTTIVVTQYGARLLGLFPCCVGSSRSVLWVNPNLASILSGKAENWDVDGEGNGGIGGDRLWVSPEQNYFYKDPENFEEWYAQLQMDPGDYKKSAEEGPGVCFQNRYDLHDGLLDIDYEDVLSERQFQVLDNPLKNAADFKDMWKEVGFAGVEINDKIELAKKGDQAPVLCPWGLTQVPMAASGGSGTVIVPTGRKASPIGYFGDIPSDRIRLHDDQLVFRVDGQKVTKLGVLAEDLPQEGPVQIAYMRPVITRTTVGMASDTDSGALQWALLIRESDDVPRSSDEAIDPAKADPEGPRGVIQSYNSGPAGKIMFGEIEMQFRPLQQEKDKVWRSKATSRILAYFGPYEMIQKIAMERLNISQLDLFA
ncbi:MAG: DUF6786 family protein [Candidatus Sumerlaeia bacterium]